eukprot:TRINITY_DN18249_c0_g1_i1.p4 TRINITY_DN18249_c0_g1~~TRINITY_DN18249_c0_g1_i1.p4  ORF type:complete len:53 (+),score=16.43 TRINITY_DN18249_c0_g1_i1:58-216(+)
MVWAFVTVVANVLITPDRNAPSVAAALVFSLAIATTSGIRNNSCTVNPITRP